MSTRGASVLKIAPPYDESLIHRIERGFTDRLGFDVRFDVTEDPSLLCGFIAYISGTVYDASGKTQLVSISAHLLDSIIVPAPSPAPAEEDD